MYQNILFDLDGTLTDPGIGITNSVMYALKKFHIEVEDRATLYRFIGPPLKDSFEKYYGFSKEESELALQYYREYFRPCGLYENKIYDGIKELLIELKSRNKTLLLATSKPEKFAIEILKYFDLYQYFDFVAGATMDSSRVKKKDVILYALQSCNISDLSSAVMIGDREQDILGANEAGLDSIGVLYGYGDEEELKEAGVTYIVESAEEICEIILGNE